MIGSWWLSLLVDSKESSPSFTSVQRISPSSRHTELEFKKKDKIDQCVCVKLIY